MSTATVTSFPHGFPTRLLALRAGMCRLFLLIFAFLVFAVALVMLNGCGRLREHNVETVYVVAQTYLKDRVAPVATNVVQVTNGEPLEVVEHSRRFLKVKTGKGEVGWIEDHLVIPQSVYDQFIQLKEQHDRDPVVARGILRDELYMHLSPGRQTDRFYLLPANDKVRLLVRASVPRQTSEEVIAELPRQGTAPAGMPGARPAPQPVANAAGENSSTPATAASVSAPAPAPAVPMEDWWLVRDNQGRTGWLLARYLDLDVPDEVAQYSEEQKMVAAYVLTKVYDPGSSVPDKEVPVYLAVLNSYKDGLPYDFNQFRVFTWDVKKHRYETAYRQRDIEGYLPVTITQEKVDGNTPVPVFAIRVATSDTVNIDPNTGAARPAQTMTLRFALEGPIVKKLAPSSAEPGATPVHPPGEHPQEAHRMDRSMPAHHRAGTGG